MKIRHLVNAGKTNPKRTQYEPKRTQSKPICRMLKMNVNNVLTKDYEKISNWAICENEPKTNPIKPNLLNALLLSISLTLPILTHPSCQLGVVAPFSMPKFAFFPSQIAEYLPAQAIFASPNHSNHRQLQSTIL